MFLQRKLAEEEKKEPKLWYKVRDRGSQRRGKAVGKVMWKGEERGMSVLTVDGR